MFCKWCGMDKEVFDALSSVAEDEYSCTDGAAHVFVTERRRGPLRGDQTPKSQSRLDSEY